MTSTPRPRFLYSLVPAFDSLRTYSFSAARADLLAGLSVAAVALPQAMAYAMIAGLPAQYGLYTAIVMTMVGALLDSSRQLINGPTNAISIALWSAIGSLGGQDERIQAAVLVAFLVGAIQLGISVARLGDLTRYISHSVMVGFTVGASLLTEFVMTADGFARGRPPDDVDCERILIFGLEGEMYFGSGGSLEQHLDTIEARVRPETQAVLIRLERARNADAVGLSLLEKFVARLQARGLHVILCGVQESMLTRMRNCGFGEELDASHVFPEQPIKQTSTAMAIRFAYDLLTDFCPTCPRRRGGFEALHYDI